MDIEDGGELIEKLVDEGMVKSYADLYKVEPAELEHLEWTETLGQKRSKALVASIEDSKHRPFAVLIHACLPFRAFGAKR